MNAQTLQSHKWEHRILLILTEDTSLAAFEKQYQEIFKDKALLADLKLTVYSAAPDLVRANEGSWKAGELYSRYRKNDTATEVILIGLDGRVKERYTEFVSMQSIYNLIATMPMRQSELKSKDESIK